MIDADRRVANDQNPRNALLSYRLKGPVDIVKTLSSERHRENRHTQRWRCGLSRLQLGRAEGAGRIE
jgi:hypothetical protein